MPVLPLDHPEPFVATLGVMLYPGFDDESRLNAKALASHWLGEPISKYFEAGHRLSDKTLMTLLADGARELVDIDQRIWAGSVTGELFGCVFGLASIDEPLASWENAIRIAARIPQADGLRPARTTFMNAKRDFLTVAHLWAAWTIRGGKLVMHPELNYDGWDDFQSFLTESEILRDFGQKWRSKRAKSKPLLPAEVWRVPDGWQPPPRKPGWPLTGRVLIPSIRPEILASLRKAGRPRQR